MPGNLKPASPTAVMPMSLSKAFEEMHFLSAFVNEHADGRSTRRALAFNDRHTFRISRPLTDSQLATLRQFYLTTARFGTPFYFYNTRETQPLGSWDGTGINTVGRYTVVWEGGWSETLGLGRNEASFVLREVV